MKQCRTDCIHAEACRRYADNSTYWQNGDCPIYKPSADVVPKSEAERLRFNLEAVLEEIPETKREVAREIFEEIEKVLNRKIARSKPHFEKLKNRDEDFLSKSGCEDMGYFKGIISTCEDFQDLIAVLKEKYTESEGGE